MTNCKKESSQLTIYEWIKRQAEISSSNSNPLPGGLDINKELKATISKDLRHATDEKGKELFRYEAAGRMSELLGKNITKTTIDNWTTQSHPHEIIAIQIPTSIIATGGQRRTRGHFKAFWPFPPSRPRVPAGKRFKGLMKRSREKG